MTEKMPSKPTLDIREALNELLRRNEHTQGKEVGDMYLGSDVFIAQLRRPKVVEGDWEDIDKTVDLFELIVAHQRGETNFRGKERPPGPKPPSE